MCDREKLKVQHREKVESKTAGGVLVCAPSCTRRERPSFTGFVLSHLQKTGGPGLAVLQACPAVRSGLCWRPQLTGDALGLRRGPPSLRADTTTVPQVDVGEKNVFTL